MKLELDKLTESQRSILEDAVGKGLWDHITEGGDLPKSIIAVIKWRLSKRLMPPFEVNTIDYFQDSFPHKERR